MPAEIVAELERSSASEEGAFGVWSENWDITQAFLAIDTQWRALTMIDGRVYWMGLDYQGAKAGLELAGIELTPDQWVGVTIMEREARNAMNGERG